MKRRTFLAASTVSIAGLSGCMADTEYRVTKATTEMSTDPLVMSVERTVKDATIEHPAELTFTLENTGDEPVRIKSYGVWPFGMLGLLDSPGGDDYMTKTGLYSPSYETSDRVEVKPTGMGMSGEPLTRTIKPGKLVSRRYELDGDDIYRAGTYYVVPRFDDRPSSYTTGDSWSTLDYRLQLDIEKKERLPF